MVMKMNLNGRPLRISTISDIHLAHRRNTTEFIIDNLNKYFSCDEHLSKVDMVVFVGDVFDDLISLSSEEVSHIDSWIARFLRMCFQYNVLVRVLEGTPSHDRLQSDRFRIINEIHRLNSDSGIDLQYVKTLSIEHIDRFDIDCLYVPDEWNHDTADTLIEVKELLKAKGLTQVDFSFVHGQFGYQMGSIIKDNIKHNEEEYLAITKYLIFVGHIHIASNYQRIYSQGSFDRLAMGEEGPKGYLSAIVNSDGTYEMTFVENVTAKKFITVLCPYDDMELNLKKLDKAVKKLPPESFVRVESNAYNPIINSIDTLKRRWPLLHWSMLPKDKEEESDINELSNDTVYLPVIIDNTTLVPLVLDRITKLNVSADTLDRCTLHLKEMAEL
jgi:UDP-2,3-diacylglucosamine pyrophosphatase LpxH